MKFWQLLVLFSALLTAPTWANVKVYFNQNQRSQYTEPYRKVTRYGDNLEQVLLGNIAQAKKSIFIAVQELRLPLVAKALVQKKNQGVDVRVVLEHDYNFTVLGQHDVPSGDEYDATKLRELIAFVDLNGDGKTSVAELEERDAIYILTTNKIPIMDDTFDISQGSGLMHHKFMLVDEKTVVISSANFTMSCIHGDMLSPGSRGNANSMVTVESLNLAKIFKDEFGQLWGNGRRGNFGHNKTYRGAQTVSVRGTNITVQFSPTSSRYNWEESVNGLIANYLARATQSIKAALFVFSDQKLGDTLEGRRNAGVDIGFLIEPKFATRDYSELLDMMGVQMLNEKCTYEPGNRPWKNPIKEAGMAILPRGDVLHHKFAVVDRKTVIVGSQNWSEAANYVNDETLIVIQDSSISDLYTQEYERLRRSSVLGPTAKLKDDIRRLETVCSDLGLYF